MTKSGVEHGVQSENTGQDTADQSDGSLGGVWSVSGVYRGKSLERVSVIIMQSIFIIQDKAWDRFSVERSERASASHQKHDFRS